ncbi:type 2 lanthipeptide synthetase LanM family protein [Luteimonas suaedae]|uniref:type 2 lanthipeptide synthetase LanM family protein n=1 Tax=Luteimonas suaedae TaxID=2605430 RepID=UPI0011F07D43|nr:type 2 lanthipeptide synthetase LanM family protein [Luteimonas suaedae]
MASAESQLDAGNFKASLGCLISPFLEELATQLVSIPRLNPKERDVVLSATETSLCFVLHAKLSRLLVLELNAARVTGRLSGNDPKHRWIQFVSMSSRREFWAGLAVHYPPLLDRVETIVRNRCAASLEFAGHWASDREHIDALHGRKLGDLEGLSFGAGDSHRHGRTVAIAQGKHGRIVYKPRPLGIDVALRHFVDEIARDRDDMTIGVPKAAGLAHHGWSEFVEHRHAAGKAELRDFYRGIGHWLAIMRLLGGSDLHAENLIAHGGSPVIVDCETLFTPAAPAVEFGFGRALDRAAELLAGTVLNMGLLPGRGIGLGWRGIDSSAVGMLSDQQPVLPHPDILDIGTDEARIGTSLKAVPEAQNHPSRHPALADYWPEVLRGFEDLTGALRRLDADGQLRVRMEVFSGCHVRIVPRASETYAEIGRMLWHPVSLHNPEPARRRAFDLLQKMAANIAFAPDEAETIEAEIDDLLTGDVPFFSARVREGAIEGPRETTWRALPDPIEGALARWRSADHALDRSMIRASLVSAYINDGWRPEDTSLLPRHGSGGDLDARRRRQAALIVGELVSSAIRGEDGSISWIAPVLGPSGWTVQPLPPDLYTGLSGIALLTAAYLRESAAGRADPVAGLEETFAATFRSLGMFDRELERSARSAEGMKIRPPALGGFIGLGSQIWTYLLLADWGMDDGEGLARALALAGHVPGAVQADGALDLLSGAAGAIAPLLALSERSGQAGFIDMAATLGDRLCESAKLREGRACWPQDRWPDGIGGFAHGVTGIGWALARLARQTSETRHRQTAEAAFAFEEALFDAQEQNWRDLRNLPGGQTTSAAWCHGSVGIGLAHLDLDPEAELSSTRQTLRRAAAATYRRGLGWNHCICHGDLGAWELLSRAATAGEAPGGLDPRQLLDRILTSLETHGASCGITRDAFVPGLLPGVGGIAYQLLRAHPDSGLPSVMLPGRWE